MRLDVRKREVADMGTLEKLVVDNVDGIEAGLAVIDSRLMLGHATVDLVAQDASGALVLMALGFRGDEGMLLSIVDAYSWCLEYPESVQRHYPTLSISEDRPPRVVFVMSRVPESFQRKVKQLSFPSVDAVEVHYIDVNGTPAVYFDTIAQIRRTPDAATMGQPARARAVAAPGHVAPEPVRVAAPVVQPPVTQSIVESVLAPRPEASIVVSATQIPTPGEPAVAPVVKPIIAGASDVIIPREPVSLTSAMCHVIDASARVVGEEVAHAVAVAEVEPESPAAPIADVEPSVERAETVSAAAEPVATVAEPTVEVVTPVVETAPAAPMAAAEPSAPTADAAPNDPNQKYPFSEAARAAQLAQDLGIQLPKEGALTRQWIDFLNQLAAK